MKSKHLFTAIGNIDDRFINEDADGRKRAKTFIPRLKLAVPLAACLVLAIAVLVSMPFGENSFALTAFAADISAGGTITKRPLSLDSGGNTAASIRYKTGYAARMNGEGTANEDFIVIYRKSIGFEVSGNNITKIEFATSDGGFMVFDKGEFNYGSGSEYAVKNLSGKTKTDVYWTFGMDRLLAMEFVADEAELPPLPEKVTVTATATYKDGTAEQQTVEFTP